MFDRIKKAALDKTAKLKARVKENAAAAKAEAEKQQKAAESGRVWREKINLRWPPDRFPRVDEIYTPSEFDRETPSDSDRELLWFRNILKLWPDIPANDAQRIVREKMYWQRALLNYVNEETGQKELKPKQEIIDSFEGQNHWILREYYAATGNYNEPFRSPKYVQMVQRRKKLVKDYNRYRHFSGEQARVSQLSNELIKLDDKLRDFETKDHKEYYDKWGGWYYMNIANAFANVDAADFGPSVAASPANHPASDDLDYKPTV